jgi:hypothetical protein
MRSLRDHTEIRGMIMHEITKVTMRDVRLHVRFEDGSSHRFGGDLYGHIIVVPVIVARREGDDKADAHSCNTYSLEVPAAVKALHGLTVSAQMDESTAKVPGRLFYGYEVHYHRERLNLRDAEAILPVLRRLDKRMTELTGTFGAPQDLTAYLARLAVALLPKGTGHPFVRRLGTVDSSGQPRAEEDYEWTGHRSMDVDQLRYWIQRQAELWRGKHGIVLPEAG